MDQVGQTRAGRLTDQPPGSLGSASPHVASGSPEQEVQRAIQGHKVVVFSKLVCPKCRKSKEVLSGMLGPGRFEVVELDQRPDGPAMQDVLEKIMGTRTVPRVFIGGRCIGGSDELEQLHASGQLQRMLGAA